MSEVEHPLPSLAGLFKATAIALVVAAVVLVGAILPAEYGIDPTGLGKRLGLVALSEASVQGGGEGVREGDESIPYREDEVSIDVPPGKGLEYKVHLAEGGKLSYFWATDGDPLYFDFHGEPQGDTSGYFESYAESTHGDMTGTLFAPFAGSHGWYFENRSTASINVVLELKGHYEVLGIQ